MQVVHELTRNRSSFLHCFACTAVAAATLVATLGDAAPASADSMIITGVATANTRHQYRTDFGGPPNLQLDDSVSNILSMDVGCRKTGTGSVRFSRCSKIHVDFPRSVNQAELLENGVVTYAEIFTTNPTQPGLGYQALPATSARPSPLEWSNQPEGDADFAAPLEQEVFDVTDAVVAWLDGSLPEHGFVIEQENQLDGLSAIAGSNFDHMHVLQRPIRLRIMFTPDAERLDLAPVDDNSTAVGFFGGPTDPKLPPPMNGPTPEFDDVFADNPNRVGCQSTVLFNPPFTWEAVCWNSYLAWELPEDLEAEQLVEATLRLDVTGFAPSEPMDGLTLARPAAPWDPTTLTGMSELMAGALLNFPSGDPMPDYPIDANGAIREIDVTEIVADWLDGTIPNEGIVLTTLQDPIALLGTASDTLATFSSNESLGLPPDAGPTLGIVRNVPVPEPSPLHQAVGVALALAVLARRNSPRTRTTV